MPALRSPAPRTGAAYLDAVLDEPGGVLAIAHRGGAGHPELAGLENTRAAFAHAASLGYRYLETDVHLTRDGVLVAAHDADLGRVGDRAERIADLTAAELAGVRIAGEHAVPVLADLLEEFPRARFNVDLKGRGTSAALARLLAAHAAEDRVCVGSFSLTRLRGFRRVSGGRVATSAAPQEVAGFVAPSPGAGLPGVRRLVATGRRLVGGGTAPLALQVPARRGPLALVTPALVARAHAAGLHVHVWTVDEPAEMGRLLDLGVDGLITDRTDLLKQVLLQRGQWGRDGDAPHGEEETS